MAIINRQPAQRIFELRFSVRTLLIAVTIVSLVLAGFEIAGLQQTLEPLFAIGSIVLLVGSIWFASRDSVRALGVVLVFHLMVATFLAIGPVAARLLDDRRPIARESTVPNASLLARSLESSNSLDFDPGIRFVRDSSILRRLFRSFSVLTVALFVAPPTAPIVAATVPILLLRLYPVLTKRQMWCGWCLWTAASLPMLYFIFCEAVIERWFGL